MLFRCRRDCEGMPFILSNGWYSQEDVVTRLVVELQWSGENKVCNLYSVHYYVCMQEVTSNAVW